MLLTTLKWSALACILGYYKIDGSEASRIKFKKDPAPDSHRCGVCPTYFQKICAFESHSNQTYIFDNHCLMDLYNCLEGEDFAPMNYEHCLFFGNFAYVHGFKYEDADYDETNVQVLNTNKNPDFA